MKKVLLIVIIALVSCLSGCKDKKEIITVKLGETIEIENFGTVAISEMNYYKRFELDSSKLNSFASFELKVDLLDSVNKDQVFFKTKITDKEEWSDLFPKRFTLSEVEKEEITEEYPGVFLGDEFQKNKDGGYLYSKSGFYKTDFSIEYENKLIIIELGKLNESDFIDARLKQRTISDIINVGNKYEIDFLVHDPEVLNVVYDYPHIFPNGTDYIRLMLRFQVKVKSYQSQVELGDIFLKFNNERTPYRNQTHSYVNEKYNMISKGKIVSGEEEGVIEFIISDEFGVSEAEELKNIIMEEGYLEFRSPKGFILANIKISE